MRHSILGVAPTGRARLQQAIVLLADARHQSELGFEEVNVLLLVLQQSLEDLLRDVVLGVMKEVAGLGVEIARAALGLQIALKHLFQALADHQRSDVLEVRMILEEQDAVDQLVGVLHLLDRFLALV